MTAINHAVIKMFQYTDDTIARLEQFYPYSFDVRSIDNNEFSWCVTVIGTFTWRGSENSVHMSNESRWSIAISPSFDKTRYFFKTATDHAQFVLRFG